MPTPKIAFAIIIALAVIGFAMGRLHLWVLVMSAGTAAFFAASIWPKRRNMLGVTGWVLWGLACILGIALE